jgi:hypothetical protein
MRVVPGVVLSVMFVGGANAYELKRTDAGASIRWARMPIPYHIADQGARDLGKAASTAAVHRSLSAWSAATDARITVRSMGTTSKSIGFIPGGENQNTIAFGRDAWAFEPEALAMTITAFRRDSGELVDADILVNERHFTWGDADPSRNDLQNALTHEVGHFLGLAHSDDPEATMYASAVRGETVKRSLSDDDVAGARALYPEVGAGRIARASGAGRLQKSGAGALVAPAAPAAHDTESAEPPPPEVRFTGCAQTSTTGSTRGGLAGLLLLGLAARRSRSSVGAVVRRWAAVCVATLGLSFVGIQLAQATTLRAPSLEALAMRSTLVARGVVTDQSVVTQSGLVFTDSVLVIEECFKGDCTAREVVVRTMGGELGDFVVEAEGMARFTPGEEVLVFLEPLSGTDRLRTSGLALGKFRVERAGGRVELVRELEGLHLLGEEMEAVHLEPRVALETMITRLRGALAP